MADPDGIGPAIAGTLVAGKSPIRSFGDGRVCAHDECDTVLSRYNRDDRCAVHVLRDNHYMRGRGRRRG